MTDDQDDDTIKLMSGRYVDDEAERASFAALGDELERGERP